MKKAQHSRFYKLSMANLGFLFFVLLLLSVAVAVAATATHIYYDALESTPEKASPILKYSKENKASSDAVAARKLLALNGIDEDGSSSSVNRVGGGSACTKDNILVFQGQTQPLPNGIPTYTVQVENVCVSGSCSISNIHINCGWFSSARLINPRIFRRIDYDDCLVNDGEPLNPGECISFQYANTYAYSMAVSSVDC